MLSRLRTILSKGSIIRRFGAGGGASGFKPGDEAPRVEDQIIWINVRCKDGYFHRVPCFEGEALLVGLLRAKIPGIDSFDFSLRDVDSLMEKPTEYQAESLNGEMNHIILEPEYEKHIPMHLTEFDRLNQSYNLPKTEPTSRFACNIEVQPWMENMKVRVGDYIDEDVDYTPFEEVDDPWYLRV